MESLNLETHKMNSLNGQPQISCVNKLTGAFITFPTDGFLHEQMEDVVEQDDGDGRQEPTVGNRPSSGRSRERLSPLDLLFMAVTVTMRAKRVSNVPVVRLWRLPLERQTLSLFENDIPDLLVFYMKEWDRGLVVRRRESVLTTGIFQPFFGLKAMTERRA